MSGHTYTHTHTHTHTRIHTYTHDNYYNPRCVNAPRVNESTEVQTLGAICIQLYHQRFEQVWQDNFTSIIGLRRSTQRHRSSKVRTSIVDLRKSTHRSSKVDTSIIDLRRSTHRSSKIGGGNIASTTQHRADIPTIRHRILSTTALHNYYTQDSAR